ncbi:hypothetical protein PVAP13_9NG737577 [Panicum virgatum]|uniref:Uncharacterized protein n=1 Tax=Panicum virgatum TaxID=38727 RepID=A0A8T0N897_PANVG|nr:hypothetical protein PVAP13_9NG737577 [Panicum virgatum]KAG2543297.1 hypothetical protein PVAP13_9NG737577 [Panicum virgatum]
MLRGPSLLSRKHRGRRLLSPLATAMVLPSTCNSHPRLLPPQRHPPSFALRHALRPTAPPSILHPPPRLAASWCRPIGLRWWRQPRGSPRVRRRRRGQQHLPRCTPHDPIHPLQLEL